MTDEEAALVFTKMIETSLSARSTKINFFIHNLAQRKGSVNSRPDAIVSSSSLSFNPEVETLASSGRIVDASVIGFEKRYDHEHSKFYVYNIQVQREDGTVTSVYRRFSEFNEFYQKLSFFTKLELPNFPNKIYVGRSHTRAVSEKRQKALHKYMQDLLVMPPAVSESDLLYTFLCTMQRDVHDANAHRGSELVQDEVASFALNDPDDFQRLADFMSVHGKTGELKAGARPPSGEVNLLLKHVSDTLYVTVIHARQLSPNESGTANPGCTLHLLPKLSGDCKRKTTTKSETLNPTWNETVIFTGITAENIAGGQLVVSVYDRDLFSENVLLGEALVELANTELIGGTSAWFKLKPRPS